jgi:hypothetical protein
VPLAESLGLFAQYPLQNIVRVLTGRCDGKKFPTAEGCLGNLCFYYVLKKILLGVLLIPRLLPSVEHASYGPAPKVLNVLVMRIQLCKNL